jgi:putative hydrolase of the HAD superfamily
MKAESLLHHHETRNIRAVVFDMDDTLYACNELRMQFRKSAWLLIAQNLCLTETQAEETYHRIRECLTEEKGYRPSNWDILIHLGISEAEWVSHSIQRVDPRKFLQRDDRLLAVLKHLKKSCRLGILTNNNGVQAERILSVLEINDLMDVVHAATAGGHRKPDPRPFRQIVRELGCSAAECLVVGNDRAIDLNPAAALGMATYHVQDVTGVYRMMVRPRDYLP